MDRALHDQFVSQFDSYIGAQVDLSISLNAVLSKFMAFGAGIVIPLLKNAGLG